MITQPLAPVHSNVAFAGHVRRRPKRPQRAASSVERLEELDAEPARRAGEAGRLRFEMGRGLDLLERNGGHHALGFSSIDAYALERCERSASWSRQARKWARRLEGLPPLADALVSGSLSWTMAGVLATVACAGDAEFWLATASGRTVREMESLLRERRGEVKEGDVLEATEELRTLTLTVPREDAWYFEQAKLLGRHLGERTHAGILCSELPSRAIELTDDEAMALQRAWERELAACGLNRKFAASRTSVEAPSRIATSNGCSGRSRPKRSIDSFAGSRTISPCAKSPLVAHSTPFSPPMVGVDSATRTPGNMLANASVCASRP